LISATFVGKKNYPQISLQPFSLSALYKLHFVIYYVKADVFDEINHLKMLFRKFIQTKTNSDYK